MSKPTEDQRAAMLAEVEAAMLPKIAPPHAISFQDLLAGAPVGTSEVALRAWLRAEVKAGRWAMTRSGSTSRYWKV